MFATRRFDNQTVTVTTSDTVLFSLASTVPQEPDYYSQYRIFLRNDGAIALNSCKIQGRNFEESTWRDIVHTNAGYTTMPDSVRGFMKSSLTDVDPTTLAVGATWEGAIDIESYSYVRMIATVASGSTDIFITLR